MWTVVHEGNSSNVQIHDGKNTSSISSTNSNMRTAAVHCSHHHRHNSNTGVFFFFFQRWGV